MSKILVSIADGKYTVVLNDNYTMNFLRYGEPWPAVDAKYMWSNLISTLARELHEARAAIAAMPSEEAIRRNEQKELAAAEKWILQHPAPHSPDHACQHCVPHSDILVKGFVCAYHRAAIRARNEEK